MILICALIHALRVKKGWGVLRTMKEFSSRQWQRSTLNDLIKRIDETGIRDIEHLKEVLQTCWEQIGQNVMNHAIGQFADDFCLLLQLVEDKLTQPLTNVHNATCTLSYLRVLL